MCFINHVTLCLFINQTCTHRRLPTQFNRVLCPLLIVHFNFTPKAFRNFSSQPEGGLKLINSMYTLAREIQTLPGRSSAYWVLPTAYISLPREQVGLGSISKLQEKFKRWKKFTRTSNQNYQPKENCSPRIGSTFSNSISR